MKLFDYKHKNKSELHIISMFYIKRKIIHYDFEKNRYILLIRNKNAYKNLTFLILLYVYNHIIIL
ncbi:hypothetical protein PFNF135_03349 [Plasmodium falciparum NF135/5.C10]|uniref:Uncharacterized protein n=2 Tax=Plasmodium falciparum TaxID=5833 RepID=A0A024V5Y3_PLAFA|nr:hypothetical protein PFFVO_03199 [Plasmodium falciparum Vietnam Oak-Knoll (FVO)]ETW42339.1 hypothetical protein PFNF135_03349 [Plasmodium falciparum NF135/5.C10]